METIQNLHRSRKQRLKTMRIFFLSFMCLTVWQAASAQRVQYPATGLITVPRWEGSGIPEGWEPPAHAGRMIERGAMPSGEDDPRSKFDTPVTDDPDALVTDGNAPNPFARTSQGVVVSVGKQFVANHLSLVAPCDNAMAISDSGFIVSVDNYTVEYYDDTPDSLLQHQFHHVFLGDTSLAFVPFDPRVIYDRYAQRFILVTLAYADSAANQILLSVSKGQDPRNGWHHYHINSDTLTENTWLDFTTIGVNKHELFISGNVVSDASNDIVGNKIFQIRKREITQGQPVTFKVWQDVLDADGDFGFTVFPLSDGMMGDDYDHGMYFASTDLVFSTTNSQDLNWYWVSDTLDAAGLSITARETNAGVAYSASLNAFQLGSQAQIEISNCRVASGFHLNGVLNFVYCKNTSGYSTIVLNRLDVNTNVNQRFAWGFTSGHWDYTYPSIAFWGSDTSDADNILLCFQRTGVNIFPELAVVNFQGGSFAATSTVVKQGLGYIDVVADPAEPERWGDYTAIQRKYNAVPKECWLAGSYPFGATPNFFGSINGLNTYVAQIADTVALAMPNAQSASPRLSIFPNPADDNFTITVKGSGEIPRGYAIFDLLGQPVDQSPWPGGASASVNSSAYPAGIYLVRVSFNRNLPVYEKLVVH